MKKKSNKNGWAIFILAMTAFGMLGLGNIFSLNPPARNEAQPAANNEIAQTQNSSSSSSSSLPTQAPRR